MQDLTPRPYDARLAPAEDRRLNDSGIEVKTVYTADDLPPGELELPGEFPFTRGPYETMYRGRPWTIRQYAGYGSDEETNERFRELPSRGDAGLSGSRAPPRGRCFLLPFLVCAPGGRGAPVPKLRATVQNDLLKDHAARGNYIFPPR